jgi:F0F1-type ATP synthase epsilon subunit
MNIENCIICDTLVPELELQLDKANAKLEKAVRLLETATDEGKTWNQEFRLKFLKQVADLNKNIR